jgi:hypothetical protein
MPRAMESAKYGVSNFESLRSEEQTYGVLRTGCHSRRTGAVNVRGESNSSLCSANRIGHVYSYTHRHDSSRRSMASASFRATLLETTALTNQLNSLNHSMDRVLLKKQSLSLLACLLTSWCRIFFEKLTVTQLLKE